tara:strand:+ start:179 stop:577 length:399 start_codon:yes stop_codon:yes gene_type:complete
MTLTRATLGNLTKRATKNIEINGNAVRIQRPTPLEHSQYQMALVDKDGKWNATHLNDAILLLVSRMWIDDEGERLFKDSETKQLGSIDLIFYQRLSEECQQFALASEASQALGESGKTINFDSPAVSALNLE